MESISYFQRCIHFTLKSTQLPKTRWQVYKGKHRQWFPLRKTTNPWTRWSPGRSLWPRSRATDFVPLDLSKKYFLTDVLLCSHDNWKKVENTILWKLQQSVLLYYPGIRRFLLVMSYSFHLHLASHVMTCESSEQLRIPPKMNMQRMWNQAKGVSMLVARRETKHRDWDFSDETSQENCGSPTLRETSKCEHWRRNCDDVNTARSWAPLSAPHQKLHKHISAFVLLQNSHSWPGSRWCPDRSWLLSSHGTSKEGQHSPEQL